MNTSNDDNINNIDPTDSKIILDGIVKIYLAVTSLTNEDVCQESMLTLTKIVDDIEGREEDDKDTSSSLHTLYKVCVPGVLCDMVTSASLWTQVSPRLEIFRSLLTRCGSVAGCYPVTIVKILTSLCQVDSGDPATRLTSLMILSRLLLNTAETIDSQGKVIIMN